VRRLAALVVSAGIAAILASGAAGSDPKPTRHVETAASADWQATLRYTLSGRAIFREVGGLRLAVSRDGVKVRERALLLPRVCRKYPCTRLGPSLLELADFGLGSPVAIVRLWTGGAHCCSVARIVLIARGEGIERNFGNVGASVEVLDGERVIVSVDDRFAYVFTSYAASGFPVQVWHFDGKGLVDVTRSHPSTVRDDARSHWATYVQQRVATQGETRGVFAAWAAGMCVLGQRAKLERALADGLERGFFSGRAASDALGPRGRAYAAALRRQLAALGYCG
jgi:hypothetical protein